MSPPITPGSRSPYSAGALLLLATLLPMGGAGIAAQTSLLSFPKNGSAYRIVRGPSLVARLVLAKDGSGEQRFILDDQTPGCQLTSKTINGGTRFLMSLPIDDKVLGKFTLRAEMDALGSRRGPWRITPRVTSLSEVVAVARVGWEIEIQDGPRIESLIMPTFGGGEFDEPWSSIPVDNPIDLGAAHSMSMTAYYGADGSGLLAYSEDAMGTKPKRFLYRSGTTSLRKSFFMALEYPMPDAHLGGRARSAPVATALVPYSFDENLEKGWYRAGKLYRAWLEANARGAGGILERGRWEDRKDVPRWCKELDLLLIEQFGWYPEGSQVENPLLNLSRLKKEMQLENMLVGIWFSGDRNSPLGRYGSWMPHPKAIAQFHALRKDGIRVAGYTMPGAFDPKNPLYDALGMEAHLSEDRSGQVHTAFGGFDGAGNPITLHRLDVAAPELALWYQVLGKVHSSFSGLSGFYSDLPATAGFPDWRRRPNLELGHTESSLLGFRNIIEMSKIGAWQAQQEFVQFHEAAFEWLIPVANFGQGAVGVIGRAFKDEDRTRGVPLFQCVYSGYTQFWPADEGFGPASILFVQDAYGPVADKNMTRILAEGFTRGAVLNSSEPWLQFGKLFWEVPGPQDHLDAMLHHRDTLKRFIALRKQARAWVSYGELLRDPVLDGDRDTIVVKKFFADNLPVDQEFDKLRVPCSAWRARDGSIRILAANGSDKSGKVRLDLARFGVEDLEGLRDVVSRQTFKVQKQRIVEVTVAPGTARLLEILEND